MAFIRVGVASLVGEAGGNDATAQEVFNLYITARGGPVEGTNKEKLDWIALDLRKHVVDVVVDFRRSNAIQAAHQEVDQTPTEF